MTTTILLLILTFAGVFMFSCTDDKMAISRNDLNDEDLYGKENPEISEDNLSTVTGYFFDWTRRSHPVIITDEVLSDGIHNFIVMLFADDISFDDVRTGDKIEVTISGFLMDTGPRQMWIFGYELIERGDMENIIESVPDDILESWQNNGWIYTE